MPDDRRAEAVAAVALLVLALAGCTATGPESPPHVATTFGSGVLPAEQDVGRSSDRSAVRRAAASAMSDEIRAFVISPKLRGQEPADVLEVVTAPRSTRRRAALLGRSHSRGLAEDLEKSFVFYARQDLATTWTGSGSQSAWLDRDVWARARFHIDRWEGVRVAGDTARVLVRGEDLGTSWGGSAKQDGWRQEQLVLHRDPRAANGWRIVHHQAASTAA